MLKAQVGMVKEVERALLLFIHAIIAVCKKGVKLGKPRRRRGLIVLSHSGTTG